MINEPFDVAAEESLSFKPLAEADFELLQDWLTRPHVNRWWGESGSTLERVREKYLPRLTGRYPVRCFIMQLDWRPFGYIQAYWLKDHVEYSSQLKVPIDDKTASIDLYIGEESCLNRGLGVRAIKRFLSDFVFGEMQARQCLLGPSQSNKVAIKAYIKAGFEYVHTVQVIGEPEPEYLLRMTRAAL